MRVSNVEFSWGSETDGFAQFREPSDLLIDKRISCLILRKQKRIKRKINLGGRLNKTMAKMKPSAQHFALAHEDIRCVVEQMTHTRK